MADKSIEAGGVIYHEGDTPDFAYFIQSGRVEIVEVRGNIESRIRVVEAGRTFGEFALFDPQTLRPFMARALEPCVLNSISLDEFNAFLKDCPKNVMPFLNVCFERMKATRVKEKASASTVNADSIKKITVTPAGDKLKGQFKPMEVPVERLPFRIGGYPEGGEAARRDALHLAIAVPGSPLRVSRQQCEIAIENNGLWVLDLGSRFCTTVNGITVGRGQGKYDAPLKKGSNEIILGPYDGQYKLMLDCE